MIYIAENTALTTYRAQSGELRRPFRVPASSTLCPNDLGKHPFRLSVDRSHTSDLVQEENGRRREAFENDAATRRGY